MYKKTRLLKKAKPKIIPNDKESKVLGYFKSQYGRYGGSMEVYRYLKLLDNGTIRVVDTTRRTTSTIGSFGSFRQKLYKSTKSEWNRALKRVINGF